MPWPKGTPRPAETRARIAATLEGRPRPQSVRDKIARGHQGVRPTHATRDKLRSAAIANGSAARLKAWHAERRSHVSK